MSTNQNSPAAATPVRIALGLPLGYVQVTDLSGAVALSPPAGAVVALVEAEAQAVRWRDDGTAPLAGVGMLLASGASMTFFGDLTAVKFIQATSGAKLNVSYYG
jgi:hypothetical protein